MTTQKTQPDLDSRTDKLEALSFFLNRMIHEQGGQVHYSHARQQSIERFNDISNSDFDDITNDNKFVIKTQNGNKVITNVQGTTGTIPDWMDNTVAPDNNASTDEDTFNPTAITQESQGEDDFSELSCLKSHHPEALKQAGYNTFEDIVNADTDDLTEIPGIKNSLATELQTEAQSNLNPYNQIARRAYEARQENEQKNGTESESITLEDVQIPAGRQRNPTLYTNLGEPWNCYGLPILEMPELTTTVIDNLSGQAEDLDHLISIISNFAINTEQMDRFADSLSTNFDDLSDITATLATDTTNTAFSEYVYQPVFDEETLSELVAEEDTLGSLNKRLENDEEITSLTRVTLINGLLELGYNNPNKAFSTNELPDTLDDDEMETLLEQTSNNVQLNHPLINDVDDYPTFRTRTLPTNEQDAQLAGKILGMNEHPLDLIGHAGVGKDTLIEMLMAICNRPTVSINLAGDTITQDLMGIHKVTENGQVIFKYGTFPIAFKNGYTLVLSEYNAASQDIHAAFHQATESDAKLHVKEQDDIIKPHPEFRAITTRNPATSEYGGMKELNGATERRINSIKLTYLPEDEEVGLIDEIVNGDMKKIDKEDIRTIVQVANHYREQADTNPKMPRITTTDIQQIVAKQYGTHDIRGAIEAHLDAMTAGQRNSRAIIEDLNDFF